MISWDVGDTIQLIIALVAMIAVAFSVFKALLHRFDQMDRHATQRASKIHDRIDASREESRQEHDKLWNVFRKHEEEAGEKNEIQARHSERLNSLEREVTKIDRQVNNGR